MKQVFFFLCFVMASHQLCAQQSEAAYRRTTTNLDELNVAARKELEELDKTADNPFSQSMLTDRGHGKLVYKDQQAVGGSIIREGRSIGSSATVEESAVTINLSTPIYFKFLALQANVRGSSEDKFVSIFADDKYQKTLSAGGTLLLFWPRTKSIYKEGDRLSLHHSIRKARYENEGGFKGEFSANPAVNKNEWETPLAPNGPDWVSKKAALLQTFREKREAFLRTGLNNDSEMIDRYYNDKLTPGDLSDIDIKASYMAYLQAERDVRDILSPHWSGWKMVNENKFIADSLTEPGLTKYLTIKQKQDTYKKYTRSLATYDTIQLKAPWVRRRLVWATLKASYNNSKQPLFDQSKPDKAYKGTFNDEYGDYQVSLNGLIIRAKSKNYGAIGVGLSNMLDFKKQDLKTYQVLSWQKTGTDSVQIVKQSQAYPTRPKEVTYKTVQLQFATYWTKTVGIDIAYRGKFAKQYTDKNAASFGVFFPIQAGETTLLFMPQVKWSDEQSTPWSFGFNLSASIPGFVTK